MIIECATLLAIMGRYTRPQHTALQRERRPSREGERGGRGWRRVGGTRKRRWGAEVGVQVRGNRVSYSVDCVHRFGDEILWRSNVATVTFETPPRRLEAARASRLSRWWRGDGINFGMGSICLADYSLRIMRSVFYIGSRRRRVCSWGT